MRDAECERDIAVGPRTQHFGGSSGIERQRRIMSTGHSPRVTRSQAPLRAATSRETTADADALQDALREIQRLRQEQLQQQTQYKALLQRRDEELRRLEERTASQENQLSLTNNRASGDIGTSRAAEIDVQSRMGFKLKPDIFDGKVPLREFLSQFILIARANKWDDATKSIALAASLRGKARTVLETVENLENLNFDELKSKLELLFGEGNLTQNYYSLFTSKKQKYGEDLTSFGAEIERLARLAYPKCPFAVRDKIACAQFVSALSDNFVRRTLQLEGVTSLKVVIERAKTIKIIQESNFRETEKTEKTKKECWQCGAQGHFRSKCPSLVSEGNKE